MTTRQTTFPSCSFACDIKDHFSCLYASCECDCHDEAEIIDLVNA